MLEIDTRTGEVTNVWENVERVDVGNRFMHVHTTKGSWTVFNGDKAYEIVRYDE